MIWRTLIRFLSFSPKTANTGTMTAGSLRFGVSPCLNSAMTFQLLTELPAALFGTSALFPSLPWEVCATRGTQPCRLLALRNQNWKFEETTTINSICRQRSGEETRVVENLERALCRPAGLWSANKACGQAKHPWRGAGSGSATGANLGWGTVYILSWGYMTE